MKRLLLLATGVFIAACGGGEQATSGTANTPGGAAPQRAGKALTIKGSDTMVILGQRFAEEYMRRNPGAVIQVNGGGSGTGIASLINGTVDLAQSSRPMKEKERESVKKNRNADVTETPVALDALAVFVHGSNAMQQVTLAQLRDVYTGKITNWKQLGGKDAPVVLYGRENSSGTYEYFKEHVLAKADFAPRTQTLQGTAAVINAVSKDVNGIGYGGIAYASGVRAVPVSDGTNAAVDPSEENVRSGKYPISRKLFFYNVSTANPQLQQFVQWCTSAEGQSVVKNVGYFPLAQ